MLDLLRTLSFPKKWPAFAAMLLLVSQPVCATIISGNVTGGSAFTAGGVFVKLTAPIANPVGPPNSVGNDTFQTNNLYGFDEDQNIVLAAALAVDVGSSPLPIGTTVASHYIFFDPNLTQSIVGTVNFNSNVLAIITSTGNLANSDFLANTGVNYLNPTERGLEAGDSVTISGPRQISFNTSAMTPGDYVRVLTEFSPQVPEPGTASLWVIGLGAMAFVRKKLMAGTNASKQ